MYFVQNSLNSFVIEAHGQKKNKEEGRDKSPPKKKIKVKEVKHKPATLKKEQPQQTYIKEDKDGSKELHVTLSPVTDVIDPPEPEELIKALMVIFDNLFLLLT